MSYNSPAPDAFKRLADMYGVDTPEEAITSACQTMLWRCGISDAPVPLKPVGELLGLKRIIYDRYNQSNVLTSHLRRCNGGYEIVLNNIDKQKRYWRRSRFTIAHEIGHLIIIDAVKDPRLLDSLRRDEASFRRMEALCNQAAAELLMPQQFLTSILSESGFSTDGIQRIYDRFLVSRKMMLIRLTEVIPASTLILWKQYARHNREDCTFRVTACYRNFKQYPDAPWLPEHATVKNISRDMVSPVAGTKDTLFDDALILRTGTKRGVDYLAISCALPQCRDKAQMLPSFDEMNVPDEPVTDEAIILLGDKEPPQNSRIWETLKEPAS